MAPDTPLWLDYVSGFGQAIGGLAAVAAVAFAAFAWRASTKAVDTAERSLAEAQRSTEESVRSRIDASAPRVVVMVGHFDEPLYIPSRNHDLQGGEPKYWELLGRADVRDFPSDVEANEETGGWLYFVCRGTITNEGPSTAWVSCDPSARLVNRISPFEPEGSGSPLALPVEVASMFQPLWVLESGQRAVFEWYGGHRIGDWVDAYKRPDPPNDHGRLFLTFLARDPRGAVVDQIYVEGGGRPLEPVPGSISRWRLHGLTDMNVAVYPVQRTYLSMGETPKPPPWVPSLAADRS